MTDHRHHWRRFYLVPSGEEINGEKVYAESEPDLAYYVGWDCECGATGFATQPVQPIGRKWKGVSV